MLALNLICHPIYLILTTHETFEKVYRTGVVVIVSLWQIAILINMPGK